jgi:hypothetical protein
MKNYFKLSIISAILVTLFSSMVYGVAQQTLRMSANYIPFQLATDVVNKLENGFSPNSVALPIKIEISNSLYPFVMILDQNKKVLVTSATLSGNVPEIPQGTFDWVTAHGQDKVTWQPFPGVREALVIDKYRNGPISGYVVAGGTLKLTEDTIDKLGKDILIGWFIINCFAIVSIIFLKKSKKQ